MTMATSKQSQAAKRNVKKAQHAATSPAQAHRWREAQD
jgi:hypothetical protein